MTASVPAVLRTLARLNGAEQQRVQVDLSKAAGLAWLGDHPTGWAALTKDAPPPMLWMPPRPQSAAMSRLAAFDALHYEDRLLRMGWAFLCGPTEIGGQRRRVCLPLVSRPVRLHSIGSSRYGLIPAGDLAMFALLSDWAKAAELETSLRAGGTADWIRAMLQASGFGEVPIVGPEQDPLRLIGGDALVVVAGAGLHAGEPVVSTECGSVLFGWSTLQGVQDTALARLYEPLDDSAPADTEVVSALPLSPSQQVAVGMARTAPITVISGPPGSGKTHTLAAIALDAVAAGKSVLLASRTRNAADVLGQALRKPGGPTPIMFGDSELRQTMSRELGDGLSAGNRKGELDARDHERRSAIAAVARIERAVDAALRDEEMAEAARRTEALVPAHRASAPRAFTGDLDRLETWLDRARRGKFLAGWYVRRLAGASADVDLVDLEAAVRSAKESAAQVRIAAAGGTTLASLRDLLFDADAASRAATAAWLRTLAVSRRGAGPRRAVAALASALRSGRATRRRALTDISSENLLAALPLWVGTLADVEDILPAVPGMFDLVVIDEASHVDQPLAAPALLRGARAVIGGDPRQLRHVSFVSDQAVREALAAEGTSELADRLDVPKVSLFDAAAAAAGVHWLTEHHRSAPHLIGFAADRFYDGRIALLTTHPSIADIDCISVSYVAGARDKKGVNQTEIDAVLTHLLDRIAAGVRSIGVATPFRAQADALEQALLSKLSLKDITDGGVRVGTVHGVQGSEFDEVVISLALSDADNATAWRFVNDQNLLAVLTTRAKRLVHVVSSARQPNGLIGEYLRHATIPPTETTGVAPTDDWTARLATEVAGLGVAVRTGYPVGHWRVDLVVAATAWETRPHPDGTAAHVARWRALHGAGWRIRDAFASRFDHDPVRAALELLG